MENMNEALSLLVVGMIMVSLILFFVVVVGNAVIRLTNRYIPVTQKADAGGAAKSISSKKMAAIVAAIDIITQGKGRVDSIKKK